jgi:hypothetical protein
MVAIHKRQSVEKESIIHYQIRDIKYSRKKDRFNITLTSYFRGWPKIRVSVTYYNLEHCPISIAYINGMEYRLTTKNAEYVESISQEVTNILRSKIREVICGEEKGLKRISIFGPS